MLAGVKRIYIITRNKLTYRIDNFCPQHTFPAAAEVMMMSVMGIDTTSKIRQIKCRFNCSAHHRPGNMPTYMHSNLRAFAGVNYYQIQTLARSVWLQQTRWMAVRRVRRNGNRWSDGSGDWGQRCVYMCTLLREKTNRLIHRKWQHTISP